MKFPALKREIHALLIRRIVAICLLAMVVTTAAATYLEVQRIDSWLLDAAAKEARLFVPLFLARPGQTAAGNEAPSPEFSAALAHTSFVEARLTTPDGTVIFETSRPDAARIRQRFPAAGSAFRFGNEPEGDWVFAEKQLFLHALIPFFEAEKNELLGHLQAIYRSSPADSRALALRILRSCLIGCAAVALAGLLMYPGLLFFYNRLISNSADLSRTNNFLLKQLGTALAKSDVGQPAHNHRVLIYGVRLAEKQSLSRTEIRGFIQGAFVHDLGMLGLDVDLLLKTAALDDKERAAMQNHVQDGVAQLKRYRWLRDGLEVVRCHHEKYDGSGYPQKLRHDKIPLAARIFAIVDAFDALTSPRPYRDARDAAQAIALLERESGSHFDPLLLARFIEMAPQLHGIVSRLEGKALERELGGVLKKYLKF